MSDKRITAVWAKLSDGKELSKDENKLIQESERKKAIKSGVIFE